MRVPADVVPHIGDRSNYRIFAQAYRRQAWRTATTQPTATVTPISPAPAAAPVAVEARRAA